MANPTGKGGFGDNPQNIGNGRPKKEHSERDQLRRFKSMDETEFWAYAYKFKIVEDVPEYIDREEVLWIAENKIDETMSIAKRNAITSTIESLTDTKLRIALMTETEGKPVNYNVNVETNEDEEIEKELLNQMRALKEKRDTRGIN